MTVKRQALIWSIIYTLMIIISNTIIFNLTSDSYLQLYVAGYICFMELIIFVIINSKIHGQVLNFSMVFIIVLFVFNFGQLMIYTFFKEIYPHVRFLVLFSPEIAINGIKYINLAFTTLCVGILVAEINVKTEIIKYKDYFMNKRYDFIKVSKNIILFTFPIKIIIDFMTLIVSLTEGGPAARVWLNNFPNVLVYYGKISLIGFALLIILYKEKSVKQNFIFMFIEMYILIMMISGVRSENVGYLLIFAYIYIENTTKKISGIKLLLYGVLVVILLAFIITAGEYRTVVDKSFNGFYNTFIDALTKRNVILSLFDTCGDTGYTAQCVINKWLPLYGPSGGDSYYLGIFSVIPNIPKILTLPGELTKQSYFALKLQDAGTLSEYYLNIGGSLIGEQFFNFGLIGGSVATFIIGFFLGRTSHKFSSYLKNDNFYGLIRIIPIMFASIYWIRDYFGGGFREIIWGPLICCFIINITKRYIQVLDIKH